MNLSSVDIIWIGFSATLVFIMQAGFLCLEAGLTRSKNSISVALKNLADFGLSTMVFWMVGYGIMFGTTVGGLFGRTGFFPSLDNDIAESFFFIFQAMFCGTSVTILSGATAERMRFISYVILSIFISAIIYPVIGHWIGNVSEIGEMSGWLGRRGFIDFAGATFVHSVGGWAALAILIIIGPRHGRFPPNEKPRPITGSNLPLSTLGVLFLWIGWIGFNGGSNLVVNDALGRVLINTFLGGTTGLVGGIMFSYLDKETPAVMYLMNGILGGLVGITGNAHVLSTFAAMFVGFTASCVVFPISKLLVKCRIDDAVDAVAVHLGAGIWSMIALALFGQLDLIGTGLTRIEQLGIQLLGVGVTGVWAFGLTYILVRVFDKWIGFRVSLQAEIDGLNISEHNTTTELFDMFSVLQKQAATNDLSLRMPVEPFTEAGQIAKQYNAVMDSLQSAHSREQSLIKRLKASLDQETELNRLQANVINTVSHEFMTPLAIIKNSATMLNRYHDRLTDEKRLDYHNHIIDQVTSMSDQLEYVLEVGNPRQNSETTPIPLMYSELCDLTNRYLHSTFRDTAITLTHTGHPEKETQIALDTFLTILHHLVDNGLKFSADNAPVTVNTYLANGLLKVDVIDEGIGVPAAELTKIFDLFYRASNLDTERGLGLGLYLVQTYVNEQNGAIFAKPNSEIGMTFTLLLPVMNTHETGQAAGLVA